MTPTQPQPTIEEAKREFTAYLEKEFSYFHPALINEFAAKAAEIFGRARLDAPDQPSPQPKDRLTADAQHGIYLFRMKGNATARCVAFWDGHYLRECDAWTPSWTADECTDFTPLIPASHLPELQAPQAGANVTAEAVWNANLSEMETAMGATEEATSMGDELKAARERLIRVHKGESFTTIYGREYDDASRNEREFQYNRDVRLAVGWFLSAHDPTPITPDWLLSVGFEPTPSDMGPEYHDHFQIGRLNIWQYHVRGAGDGDWLVNDADWIELKSRGQLRSFCRVLGMTLKERT